MKETNTDQKSIGAQGHLDENELAQYIEYLRHETDQAPVQLIEHVQTCSFCRAEVMALYDMLDALPDIAEEPSGLETDYRQPSGHRAKTVALRIIRTAAAVAAVVVLSWGVKQLVVNRLHDNRQAAGIKMDSSTLVGSKMNGQPSGTTHGEGKSLIPDSVSFAAAFAPNPGYDNMVEAKYRTDRNPNVVGPGPETELAPGDSLQISWTPNSADVFELVIVDNKGNDIRRVKLGKVSSFSWKIDLNPGLYYWKFTNKEEIWKVGRMIIKPGK